MDILEMLQQLLVLLLHSWNETARQRILYLQDISILVKSLEDFQSLYVFKNTSNIKTNIEYI